MAKKAVSRRRSSKKRRTISSVSVESSERDWTLGLDGLHQGVVGGEFTGRMIATVMQHDKESIKASLRAISNMTGISASSSNVAYASADTLDDDANYHVLEELGVLVVNHYEVDTTATAAITPQDHNMMMEPEQWNYAMGGRTTSDGLPDSALESVLAPAGMSKDYLLGMRQAIDVILEQQSGAAASPSVADSMPFEQLATWGLSMTGVTGSRFSGKGVRVAVLDSGFDTAHPDFEGRSVTAETFIPSHEPDSDEQDRSGHGTHVIGTACGPEQPGIGPRYGIAHGAEIFSAKVLRQRPDGRASGADGWILAGLNWALGSECQVINMSLGSRATSANFPVSYERAAQRGLARGSLIIAATGNSSRRGMGFIDAVGRPANCPSIAAVAAIDSGRAVADFSNGQRFGNGGEVNFCGPGVKVLSSVPMPHRRDEFNGTSMATPHATGIAALICEETGLTGIDLYLEMRRRVLDLGDRANLGHGLVMAQHAFV